MAANFQFSERGWHHHAQYDFDALAKRVKEVVEKYENGYDPRQRLQEMVEKAFDEAVESGTVLLQETSEKVGAKMEALKKSVQGDG